MVDEAPEDADGENVVRVAVYQPNDAGDEWEAMGSTEVLEADSLTEIESFPAIDAVDGDGGEDEGSNESESASASESGGDTGSQQQTEETPIQSMTTDKHDSDTLAANTAFSREELSGMDETFRAKLANSTLGANDAIVDESDDGEQTTNDE